MSKSLWQFSLTPLPCFFYKYAPQGTTITKEYTAERICLVFVTLWDASCRTCRQGAINLLFHHEKPTAHSSRLILTFLAKHSASSCSLLTCHFSLGILAFLQAKNVPERNQISVQRRHHGKYEGPATHNLKRGLPALLPKVEEPLGEECSSPRELGWRRWMKFCGIYLYKHFFNTSRYF